MTNQPRGKGHPEHHIDPNKLQIVAVRKDGDGDLTDVKFQNGQTANITDAISMAKQGLIEDVNVGSTRGDNPHDTLRSYPDGNPDNNLDNLPRF